jgi:hypothetical protein
MQLWSFESVPEISLPPCTYQGKYHFQADLIWCDGPFNALVLCSSFYVSSFF